MKNHIRNYYGKKKRIIIITFILGLLTIWGCEDSLTKNTNPIPESDSMAKVVNSPFHQPETQNCTIKQYLNSEVKVDRFYCEVKNKKTLYIYPEPSKNYIGQIHQDKQLYILNTQSSKHFSITGKVWVKNKNWEFKPYNQNFLVGPSRIQVIID